MAIIKTIESKQTIISIWKIEEQEIELINAINARVFDSLQFSKINHPHKKIEWLASRALLSQLLKEKKINYNGLYKDKYGKPYLSDCKYYISISHSHKYCAVILSKNNFIGIDIESNFKKAHLLRTKYMNEHELKLAPSNSQKSTLVWSAKESMYKAYGEKELIFKDDLIINNIDSKNFLIDACLSKTEKELSISFEENKNYVLTYLSVDL